MGISLWTPSLYCLPAQHAVPQLAMNGISLISHKLSKSIIVNFLPLGPFCGVFSQLPSAPYYTSVGNFLALWPRTTFSASGFKVNVSTGERKHYIALNTTHFHVNISYIKTHLALYQNTRTTLTTVSCHSLSFLIFLATPVCCSCCSSSAVARVAHDGTPFFSTSSCLQSHAVRTSSR